MDGPNITFKLRGENVFNQKAHVALSVVNEFFFASLFCFRCLVMVMMKRAMMKMMLMMMITIWTDRSPICALFPGVLRGLLTDYQWEGVDPRHPNTSNNSSTTFTLSTSTTHFWLFLAFILAISDIFCQILIQSTTTLPLITTPPPFSFQHQHLIGVILFRRRNV